MINQEFQKRLKNIKAVAFSNTTIAKDESLHEIEFIKDKYTDENGEVKTTKIIGCIWIKENFNFEDNKKILINNNGIFINDFNIIEELTLGGELGYGFGLVKLESILNNKVFPIEEKKLNEDDILIEIKKNQPIISHLQYDKGLQFRGEIELITGRGYFDIEKNTESESENEYKKYPGKKLSSLGYYFAPGSIVYLSSNNEIALNWNGTMIFANNK